ncbi:F-box domain containing protein [Pandoravirus celtis]|uniref:F-box domain containing protein n=1 Tax=Pandoravirus celtis TaxID=2568002 RepID=A0A4D6EJS3_9VIRU|nr:F-box domain containing protein [Pandoravirus celtis]
MDALPDEIALHIVACLPLASVGRVACVSWRFNRLAMDESVWCGLYDAMCPPCTGPQLDRTCMAHKGRALDHRPWLDVQDSEEKDIHFIARSDASHPLHPFIATRPQGRDGPFDVFADAPASTCPHHCPSVIRARSYRWACASQCAPPRPIDSTGTRVGLGVHWYYKPYVYPEGTTSVYRGEWHAQSDVPDGLGMHTVCRPGTGLVCSMNVRETGTWRKGDRAGFVRHWDGAYHPNYIEGRCFNGGIRFKGAIAEGKTLTISVVKYSTEWLDPH